MGGGRLQRLTGRCLSLLGCILFTLPLLAQTAAAHLDCESISSTVLGRAVDYCVALPPGYDAGDGRSLVSKTGF
jgi:hypothetical protein